jgi:hypothetical protein
MKSIALKRIDWAYLFYAWVACAVWFEPLMEKLPIDPGYGQFLLAASAMPRTL